jgi:hypothetical protein
MSMKIVGPIEAFQAWWGERSHERRTMGSPDRTQAMAVLEALAIDAEACSTKDANGQYTLDCRIPEFDAIQRKLTSGWAGEFGWDTEQGIRGIQAATTVRQNPMAQADPNEV